MEKILEISHLSKSYPEFTLNDISFAMHKGYIMGLIGPNGAGKTTIIKCIMDLIRKDSGSITIFNKDSAENGKEIREKIGFVYDENHYYENLTVVETKNIIAPFYSDWNDDDFFSFIKTFELPVNKKIQSFSRGMKTKFAIAMALSHNPELVIMDEPTSGLDPVSRSEILDIFREVIQNEERSILFSTHITSDLDKIADYITFINKGNMVFSKSREEIDDQHLLVRGDLDLLNDDLRNSMISIKESKYQFEALTDQSTEVRLALKENVVFEKATLEDIMLYYVRRDK